LQSDPSLTYPARSLHWTLNANRARAAMKFGLFFEIARRYEVAGCDLLLCLVNPYKIPHDKVMRSIRLMGEHVLPAVR
jgi:hypothetical protein